MDIGPVSAALEDDLRHHVGKYGVVLWPDRRAVFSEFVEALLRRREGGGLPFDVVAYRGSFLELMLELESKVGGVARPPLLIHLPGFDESAARGTPLLELIEAGHCFTKPLAAIVADAAAERVAPEAIAAVRAQGDLTLGGADAWLAMTIAGQHAGVLGQLHALRMPAVLDDLLRAGVLAKLTDEPAGQAALWSYMAARSGVTEAWRDACLPAGSVRPGDLAFAVASWALCVEYVHDLERRAPADERLRAMATLPGVLIDGCRELAAHLRTHHDEFYRRTADETERRLDAEASQARAEDLGAIDTFRFEEEKVLAAALDALAAEKWDAASAWAARRLEGPSFWLRVEPPRQLAWELVLDAARLGQAVVAAGPGLAGAHSLDDAVAQYVARGASVDRAHRHLERRRSAISTTTPYFEALRERLDGVRRRWSAWADAWAREFNALCLTHGFVPDAKLRQRTLFEDEVLPLTRETGTTALLLVDALRFEMAKELFASFETSGGNTAHLRARLAELPTVTEVGMNALAPVVSESGRLRPTFDERGFVGFRSGELVVEDAATRQRTMHARVGGPKCPWIPLDEIGERSPESLRNAIRGAKLVVVHTRDGESDGESTVVSFSAFDGLLHRLRAAWSLLREAGVRRFVITADHGFLLLGDPARAPRRVDPRHRCVLERDDDERPGTVRVALHDLGYDGAPQHLRMPETVSVFDTSRGVGFVHGGNSLQERVIPVITLVHRAAGGGSVVRYRVTVEAREGVTDMHCLKIRVDIAEQAALDFVGLRELELALRTPEAPEVEVELCSARGARLAGGAIVAPVDREFELFFRLTGPAEVRVLLEIFHPTATAAVDACVVPDRYPVLAASVLAGTSTGARAVVMATVQEERRWLDAFVDPGVRRFFEHLAVHDELAEEDAQKLFGGQREFRSFTLHFKELAAKAPFGVHINTLDGLRRYKRERASNNE